MRNDNMIVELNLRDYIELKAEYSHEELLNVIRRMRADSEQARNRVCVA